jgi:transposase-like protein
MHWLGTERMGRKRWQPRLIQDFKCQACGKKFTVRRNTILYQLKSHSELIEKILQ